MTIRLLGRLRDHKFEVRNFGSNKSTVLYRNNADNKEMKKNIQDNRMKAMFDFNIY